MIQWGTRHLDLFFFFFFPVQTQESSSSYDQKSLVEAVAGWVDRRLVHWQILQVHTNGKSGMLGSQLCREEANF